MYRYRNMYTCYNFTSLVYIKLFLNSSVSFQVHCPLELSLANHNKDIINSYAPEAHLACAALLGLAKLWNYSSKIREIPIYLAAVVLDL